MTSRGSRLAAAVLRALGWRLEFEGLPARQGVIAVYPHTSNWDFPVGLLAKWAMGLDAHFWGKDTLFRYPIFGAWLRRVGGIPVDRHARHGVVAQTVQALQQARERNQTFWLVVAPEGTRSFRPGWRSGFYQVAVGAGVPLGLAHIDYGARRIGIATFLQLSGDPAADRDAIQQALGWARGLRPDQAAPIQWTSGPT